MSSYLLLRLFMIAVGLYAIWLAVKGAYTGKVETPRKYSTNVFSRALAPAKFWLSVVYFFLTGVAACAMAIIWR